MYLAHIMLLNLFFKVISPHFENVYISVPLISVCTFASIYLTIKLLSYLPKSKYWLGYQNIWPKYRSYKKYMQLTEWKRRILLIFDRHSIIHSHTTTYYQLTTWKKYTFYYIIGFISIQHSLCSESWSGPKWWRCKRNDTHRNNSCAGRKQHTY